MMSATWKFLILLVCLPCSAATVYKSVDEQGRVTFSDSPPSQAVSVELVHIQVQAPAEPELYLQRMEAMTEVTDKLAEARREREEARREQRRERQPTQPLLVEQPYYAGGYAGGRRWYGGVRPYPPGIHPPVYPGRVLAPVNDYPAKLVRRHYSPRVAAVFQNRPTIPYRPRAVPYSR